MADLRVYLPFQALMYRQALSQTSGSLQKKCLSRNYDFDIDVNAIYCTSRKLVARNYGDSDMK